MYWDYLIGRSCDHDITQSSTWKPPRPIFVFWLPRLLILSCIAFIFVTVVIYDFTYVFLPPATNLCFVDSGGRGCRIPEFSGNPLILMLLILLVLSGFIGKLGILGGNGRRSRRRTFSLRLVPAIHCFLALDFMRGDVSGSTSLTNLEINLLQVKTWP